jgi:hypothetical protein
LKRTVETIKECGEKGIGTGVERLLRWTARQPAPGGRDGQIDGTVAPALAAGNSENAANTAKANANKVRSLLCPILFLEDCLTSQ